MTIYRNKKGFTLIELIAVMAILPIALAAIFSVVNSSYKLFSSGISLSDVQEQSKTIINTLSQDLKSSRTYEDTTEIASDTRVNTMASSNKIYIEGFNNKRYMYSIIGNKLYRYTFSDVSHDNYIIQDGIEYPVSNAQYDIYSRGTNEKFHLKDILGNELTYFTPTALGALGVEYTPKFLYYDEFESKIYLFAQKTVIPGNSYYCKFLLKAIPNPVDLTTIPVVVGSHVTDITVIRNTSYDNLCTISVTAEEKGKKKILTSDVYIFRKK
ncbi:MAG TPA: type II secretion system protein [Clostridiaceae bacterium]